MAYNKEAYQNQEAPAQAYDPGRDAGLDYDTVVDGNDLIAWDGPPRCQALLDLDAKMKAERNA